jgi:hypothetical protein
MQDDNISLAVLLTSVFFAFLTCSVIYFVVLYRNRQLKNKQEQEEREAAYRQELLKTQIEIQEQTFENISREIHDNITQVLSFVKLSLGTLGNTLQDERKIKLNENRELISQSINDLRDLSKSMSFEHIIAQGLIKTIEKEVVRFNKIGLFEISFTVSGRKYSLGEQRELVLFRILQETLNNSTKHSGAKHFKINLQYNHDLFNLTLEDDGSGFSPEQLDMDNRGSGLRNMANRATLIGGNATIESAPGKGCRISVALNPFKQLYKDGIPHPNSLS